MLVLGTVAFLGGCLCINYLKILPSIYIALALLITGMSLGLFLISTLRQWNKIGWLIILFFAGFFWTWLNAFFVLKKELSADLESKNLTVIGIVTSIPEQSNDLTRFEFNVQHTYLNNQEYLSPGKIRLAWQGNVPQLNVGSIWQFNVRLKRPHTLSNPGGFDQEQWDFAHRIRANGYIENSDQNKQIGNVKVGYELQRLRQNIFLQLQNLLNGQSYAGFITALTVGVRNAITTQQWEDLRNTGTNHLMAIAGLHIGFIVAFMNYLARRFWSMSQRLCLWLPAPKAGAIGALIAAIIYSLLAGFALPTQRAIIMLGIHLLGVIFDRPIYLLHTVLSALFIILCLDPLSILTESFWLSFFAVAAILYGMSGRIGQGNLWWRYGRVQWVIAVGLVPLSLLFFQQVSLIGIAVNFFAIPFVGFLILPLCWLGLLALPFSKFLSHLLFTLVNQLFSWIWPLFSFVGHWNLGQWYGCIPNVFVFLGAMMACGLLIAPAGFPGRRLCWLGLLPVIINHSVSLPQNTYELSVLDVGQGLASVIQTQHHTLIFDTGAKLSPDYDMGNIVVLPFLRYQGIHSVDTVVISHGDNDHRGGLESILAGIHVNEIDTSVPELQSRFSAKPCVQGIHWQWDGVQFEYLYPPPNQVFMNNDSSCVLRISNGKVTSLLTGDIEHKSEKWLVQNASAQLPAQILVAPHHGSKTSSTPIWLGQVKPQVVVFSTGYLNRYHFPHPLIVSRYQEMGTTMYNTASCGEINFYAGMKSQASPCYREIAHHYWMK